MRITDLVATGYVMCLDGKKELHQQWISQSFKLAEIAGVAHIATIQANNRLDLLIRQFEEEWEKASDDAIDFRWTCAFRFRNAGCCALMKSFGPPLSNLTAKAFPISNW